MILAYRRSTSLRQRQVVLVGARAIGVAGHFDDGLVELCQDDPDRVQHVEEAWTAGQNCYGWRT